MRKVQIVVAVLLFLMPALSFAQKLKAKKVVGMWVVAEMNAEKLPEGLEMTIEFKKDGEMLLNLNGESVQEVKWTITEDAKGLTISMPEVDDEVWEVGSISKSEMLIVDGADRLLLRRDGAKSKKKKAKKKKKVKANVKKVAGYWRAKGFNGQELPEEVQVYMTLTKEGSITMETMGEEEMQGEWSLGDDKASLEIKGQDGKEEVWQILALKKTEMTILSGDITIDLVKEDKK